MKTFVARLAVRTVGVASICALAAGMTLSTPSQAKADAWAAGAVGAILLGIVYGGGKKEPAPSYTVLARYCLNTSTGLYVKC